MLIEQHHTISLMREENNAEEEWQDRKMVEAQQTNPPLWKLELLLFPCYTQLDISLPLSSLSSTCDPFHVWNLFCLHNCAAAFDCNSERTFVVPEMCEIKSIGYKVRTKTRVRHKTCCCTNLYKHICLMNGSHYLSILYSILYIS